LVGPFVRPSVRACARACTCRLCAACARARACASMHVLCSVRARIFARCTHPLTAHLPSTKHQHATKQQTCAPWSKQIQRATCDASARLREAADENPIRRNAVRLNLLEHLVYALHRVVDPRRSLRLSESHRPCHDIKPAGASTAPLQHKSVHVCDVCVLVRFVRMGAC